MKVYSSARRILKDSTLQKHLGNLMMMYNKQEQEVENLMNTRQEQEEKLKNSKEEGQK